RGRHTTWPRDWSSDVCSSDLQFAQKPIAAQRRGGALAQIPETKGEFMIRRLSTSLLRIVALLSVVNTVCQEQSQSSLTRHVRQEIGRASCRERALCTVDAGIV